MNFLNKTAFTLILAGCTPGATRTQNTPSNDELNFSEITEEMNHSDDTAYNPKSSLRHPKKPDASSTFVLISIQKPNRQIVDSCKQQLTATVPTPQGFKELLVIAHNYETEVKTNIKNHHWCFYQVMADVDSELNKSKNFNEQADFFVLSMQKLYVLARGLDKTIGVTTYTDYLRTRYTQISQQKFGRSLNQTNNQILQK